MPYVEIGDFRAGMNRQRQRTSGAAGTLWVGKNVVISRGGDVERVKKFVSVYTLPAGTFGLQSIGGQLFVYGSADLAASIPAGVNYLRLEAPGAPAMISVLWSGAFDGTSYVIAEYANGEIHHFFGTARVTAWDTAAATNSNFRSLASYLARKVNNDGAVTAIPAGTNVVISARVPGVAFTITAAAANGGSVNDQTATVTTVQANVAAVAETRATGTITITSGTSDPGVNTISVLTVDGVNLLGVPVNFGLDNDATAALLSAEINNMTATSGYSASAAGAVVTITANPGAGVAPNGDVIAITTTGDVTATTSGTVSGGVAKVNPVRQISQVALGGTYEAADTFTITINSVDYISTGRASGHATLGFVYKKRIYFIANSLLYYTKINDATDITDASAASGAGFINLTNDSEGAERLTSLAQYQEFVAAFSRSSIRIYDLQTDAQLNVIVQPLSNTGTYAPLSTLSFGNTDTMYLSDTGLRSLQIRDLANAAFVNDVGSAIDPFLREYVRSIPEGVAAAAVAALDTEDDRYFLAIGARIFVLSYFPSPKVAAWTFMEPGFTVQKFATSNGIFYARDATKIYAYGGLTQDVYPEAGEMEAEVSIPFVAARKVATWKNWTGIDIGCTGEWRAQLLVDPRDENALVDLGRMTGPTFAELDHMGVGHSPMVALKLTADKAGAATISNIVLHFFQTRPA
jgi:hypothetical protein